MKRHPLILVVQELWFFVTAEVSNLLLPARRSKMLAHPAPVLALDGPVIDVDQSVLYPVEDTNTNAISIVGALPQSRAELDTSLLFSDGAQTLPETPKLALEGSVESFVSTYATTGPAVHYVAVTEAVCFVLAVQDFDTVLTRFSYGTAVTVTSYQGEYAKVFWSHHEGWLRKDELTPHKQSVWPVLKLSTIYEAADESVKKIRLLLQDTFYTERLGLPLQSGEWVSYRLREQNRKIPWPVTHGRLPGDWQSLLRGVSGVHVGITPKTDTIIEWRNDEGEGRLAYVEKVSPENSLTISVVGFAVSGYFEQRELPVSQWRELRPVFIEIL